MISKILSSKPALLVLNIVLFCLNVALITYQQHIYLFASISSSPDSLQQAVASFSQPQQQDRRIQVTQELPKALSQKTWCVLDFAFLPKNVRLHFNHFPHALEGVLQCYSHFIETKAIVTATTDIKIGETIVDSNCGFMIDTLVCTPERMSPYIAQVIQKLGCEVQYYKNVRGGTEKPPIPQGEILYRNNMYKMFPRYSYIKYINAPEHAHYLRRQFVHDAEIEKVKGDDKPLQIGIINRSVERRVVNLEDEIQASIQKQFPTANITYSEFDIPNIQDQIRWFATKDIIVGPHGAAFTNSLWITPGTVVLQMYPTGYYFPSLEPLIEQVDGIALQWFERGIQPEVERNKRVVTKDENGKFSGMPNQWWVAIHANFTVPADQVTKQLRAIMEPHPHFRTCIGFVDADADLPFAGWGKTVKKKDESKTKK